MGALGGWWLAQPHLLETYPELVVARHVASLTPTGPRIDVASSDRHEVRPWFQGRLEFAPMVRDLSAQGFDLLGARVERVGDRQAVRRRLPAAQSHHQCLLVARARRRRGHGDGGDDPRLSTS